MAALAAAAAGGAIAATGGGTITVCVRHNGGGLYSARHCARHDRRLSWNVQGPKGATGSQGSPGPSTGPAGGDLTGSYPNPTVATVGGHTPVTNATTASGALTGTYPSPTLANGAVDSAKVANFSLRLHNLGGQTNSGTSTVGSSFNVAAGSCVVRGLSLFNPAPNGVVGSLVVGYLTDSQGNAVLDNAGVVLPTVVSETSQGGAIPNLMVCASSGQTVPAGSVFHYSLIGP
jgi:hypothetical protein